MQINFSAIVQKCNSATVQKTTRGVKWLPLLGREGSVEEAAQWFVIRKIVCHRLHESKMQAVTSLRVKLLQERRLQKTNSVHWQDSPAACSEVLDYSTFVLTFNSNPMLSTSQCLTWVKTLYQPVFSTCYQIPLYLSTVGAGFPQPGDECVESRLDLNALIEHPHATFFARVAGDSMRGAGIFHGDIVVVDRSLEVVSGRVVVAVVNGEMLIKRVSKKGDRWFLLAENPEYPPLEITDGMEFQVWGVVTSVVHKV